MLKSDHELCIRLAEWQGKCCYVHIDDPAPDPLPGDVQFVVLHRYRGGAGILNIRRCSGNLYAPDTDPVAALELLGWMAEEPRGYISQILSSGVKSSVSFESRSRYWGSSEYEVCGPPPIALPKAITLAADEVRKKEGG